MGFRDKHQDVAMKRGGRIVGPGELNAHTRGRFPMAGGDHRLYTIFFLGFDTRRPRRDIDKPNSSR